VLRSRVRDCDEDARSDADKRQIVFDTALTWERWMACQSPGRLESNGSTGIQLSM